MDSNELRNKLEAKAVAAVHGGFEIPAIKSSTTSSLEHISNITNSITTNDSSNAIASTTTTNTTNTNTGIRDDANELSPSMVKESGNKSSEIKFGSLLKEHRIQKLEIAYLEYVNCSKKLSQLARQYSIPKSTLGDYIKKRNVKKIKNIDERDEAIRLAIQDFKTGRYPSVAESALAHGVLPNTVLSRLSNKSQSLKQRIIQQSKVPPEAVEFIATLCQESEVVSKTLTPTVFDYMIKGAIRTKTLSTDKDDFRMSYKGEKDFVIELVDCLDDAVIGKNLSYRIRRRKNIAVKRGTFRETERIISAVDINRIKYWFNIFHAIVERYHIKQDSIYNIAETGFQKLDIGQTPPVAPGSPTYSPSRTKNNTTSLTTICSDGSILPPYLIFYSSTRDTKEGLSMQTSEIAKLEHSIKLAPEVTSWMKFRSGKKGATSDLLLKDFLETHFNVLTGEKAKDGNFRLIIMDEQLCQNRKDLTQFCQRENIIIFLLPRCSSSVIQPLDVLCFPTIRANYQRLNERHIFTKNSDSLTDNEVMASHIYEAHKMLSIESIRKSFELTDLLSTETNFTIQRIHKQFVSVLGLPVDILKKGAHCFGLTETYLIQETQREKIFTNNSHPILPPISITQGNTIDNNSYTNNNIAELPLPQVDEYFGLTS
ncbi:hypothetical protein PACTADRAFT_51788 [Pachysolen tannophilus NRRL Y-2460]|uniref:DDE-1 domain-containing protein n=1 Tax=Pachysolen tannophilus NRRL Y-2460 TaxID=669874 RepID=A0A1E4TN39_PACTA|nr:hypothetical protein PACTADRAFT_51788 [Pachysolen tannophilus NRRL Y-2460]